MKLTYEHPDFPKDHVVYLNDLPGVELKNGTSVEVSDEQADAYEQRTGTKLETAVKGNTHLTLVKGGK